MIPTSPAPADLAQRLIGLVDDGTRAELSQVFDGEGLLRVSPAVGVEALVVNADDEILLCQRQDNEHWCLPGGIAEIGQPTPDAALRELWEEVGLRGEVTRLLGAFDGQQWRSRSKVHLLQLVYLVSCADLTPSPGVEMITADYFTPAHLPVPLHPGHGERIPRLIEMLNTRGVHHDAASSYDIPMPLHQRPGHQRPGPDDAEQ